MERAGAGSVVGDISFEFHALAGLELGAAGKQRVGLVVGLVLEAHSIQHGLGAADERSFIASRDDMVMMDEQGDGDSSSGGRAHSNTDRRSVGTVAAAGPGPSRTCASHTSAASGVLRRR